MNQLHERSLLEISKLGLKSFIAQAGYVFSIFLIMLVITGWEPSHTHVKVAIVLGVLCVATIEVKNARSYHSKVITKKLTVQKVLKRYATGQKDFRGVSLRGQNFTGADLSGIDLSRADIRSTNFTNANMVGVNFSEATGGQQRGWVIVQLLLVVLVASLAGFLQGISGLFIISYVSTNTLPFLILGCVYSLLVVLVLSIVGWKGIASKGADISTITVASIFIIGLSLSIAFAVVPHGILAVAFSISFSAAFAIVGAFAVAVAINIAYFIIGGIAATFAVSLVLGIAVLVASQFTLEVAANVEGAFETIDKSVFAVAFSVALATLALGCYMAKQSLKENDNFSVIRALSLAIATVGGTAFCGTDLTGANFSHAFLQNANFADSRERKTNCTHTCWRSALKLNRVRFGNTILIDLRVRTLLVEPENGYEKDLVGANFRGADLRGAILEKANLKRSILSGASLQNAVLKNANLTEVQAIKTDLTNAYLTGATIESWNIDSTTVLKGIDCQYIYMRERPDAWGDYERLPYDKDKPFRPGDFEKIFREIPNEVKILIPYRIDYRAFRAAFQAVAKNNPSFGKSSFKGIEKKGSDILVKLKVPEDTNKADLERDWEIGYKAGLDSVRGSKKSKSISEIEAAIFLLSGDDEHNRLTNIFNNVSQPTGKDSKERVLKRISKLNKTEIQFQIKQLLFELKTAIDLESNMSVEEKEEALIEVKEIALAGQDPHDQRMKKAARRSLNTLRGITVKLNKATELAKKERDISEELAFLFDL